MDNLLSALITSKTRIKLICLFFGNRKTPRFHIRDIERQINGEINAVREELQHLEKYGVLQKEKRGNRLFYQARLDYPLYLDLLALVRKTNFLGGSIIKNRSKIGRIKYACFSGNFIRDENYSPDSVDLLVIGAIVLPELAKLVKEEEQRIGREINYSPMTEEEFKFRKNRRDPFIMQILQKSKVMIIGDEKDLIS